MSPPQCAVSEPQGNANQEVTVSESERELSSEERQKAIDDLTRQIRELVLEKQVLEAVRLNPHAGLWTGGVTLDGGAMLLCLLMHDHGGSTEEPGPDCLLWLAPHTPVGY